MLAEQLERSRVCGLQRLAQLLCEHEHDLATFMTEDARGRHVPTYLLQRAQHLLAERDVQLREIASLRSNIAHIEQIVSMQQSSTTALASHPRT